MKKTIFSVALVLMALSAQAEVLSPAQALARVAEGSDEATAARRIARRAAVMPARTLAAPDGEAGLYVFTPADGGLLLLSADSEAQPLIGYSDSFTPGDALPPALEAMMQFYAAEIGSLRAGAVTYADEAEPTADMAPIDPICKTKWNQTAPYNNDCPTDAGGRCVTGCVATAMAQVLKVYEYPTQCSGGTFSYPWGNKTLTLNYDDVTLDWASMKNTYSSSATKAEAASVATLMKAVGYAAKMNYSSEASGARGVDLLEGLVRNFGYDCAMGYYWREWYTLSEWQRMIYAELEQGYPVYYDGANPDNSAGHAFVVDGYRGEGFFHLNWGWGGMSDGYFLLSALDPDQQGAGGSTAGYDRGQGAILGMRPEQTTEPKNAPLVVFMQEGFKAAVTSSELNQTVQFIVGSGSSGVYNSGSVAIPRMQLGVKFTSEETGETFYLRDGGTTHQDVGVFQGVFGRASVTMTKSKFPDGKYTATMACYNPSTKEYFDVHAPIGIGSVIVCTVADGTVKFATPVKGKARVTGLTVPETVYPGVGFEFTAELGNTTTQPFYGPLVARLYSRGGSAPKATLGIFITEVDPGQTTVATGRLTVPSNITPGEYDIRITDESGAAISTAQAVTVAERPVVGIPQVSRISVRDKSRNQLTIEMTVRCSTGLYANPIYAVLTNAGETNSIDYYASPTITVDASTGAVKATIVADFVQGVSGQRYTVYPFYLNESNQLVQAQGNSVTFTLAEDKSGIVEIENGDNAPTEYFDLNGRRVNTPGKGLYIRRTGSVTEKVVL